MNNRDDSRRSYISRECRVTEWYIHHRGSNLEKVPSQFTYFFHIPEIAQIFEKSK